MMPKFHDQALKQRVQDLEQQIENAPDDQDVTDLVKQLEQAQAEAKTAFNKNRDNWTAQRGQSQAKQGQQGGQAGTQPQGQNQPGRQR